MHKIACINSIIQKLLLSDKKLLKSATYMLNIIVGSKEYFGIDIEFFSTTVLLTYIKIIFIIDPWKHN